MQYFNTLPKIIYTQNGVSRLFTNIIARASVIPNFLKSPLIYYKYDIQEGDTPEIIAHKYYGDSYRYWIVLFANELLDPQWNWPMSTKVFEKYMSDKYPNTNTNSVVHHYEKIVTQYDEDTAVTTTNVIQVDFDTYTNLIEENKYLSLPTGNVTVGITKNIVSVYDHEVNLNEAKRNINILNSIYVEQFEEQFKKLMAN